MQDYNVSYQSHTCLKLFAGSPLNDFAIFLLRDLKYFLNNFAIFLHRELKEETPDTLGVGSNNSKQHTRKNQIMVIISSYNLIAYILVLN